MIDAAIVMTRSILLKISLVVLRFATFYFGVTNIEYSYIRVRGGITLLLSASLDTNELNRICDNFDWELSDNREKYTQMQVTATGNKNLKNFTNFSSSDPMLIGSHPEMGNFHGRYSYSSNMLTLLIYNHWDNLKKKRE